MKAKLLVTLLVLSVSSPVLSQTRTTLGAVDCGQWVARKTQDLSEFRVTTWVVGFMTGLNFRPEFTSDPLSKVSAQQIYLWMDNYCKANPLKTVVDGGQALMRELDKK